jgi:Transposase DDE domain
MTPYISDYRERHNLTWNERFKIPPPCPEDADAVTAMAHRLRTPEGKAIYAKRKSTVETVFGIIKEVMGFRRFHLRGLDAAQGEWNLVCMAWNLKWIHALGS